MQDKNKTKKKRLTIYRFDIELDKNDEYQLCNKKKDDSNRNVVTGFQILPRKRCYINTIIFPKPVFVIKSHITQNKVALVRFEKAQQFMNRRNFVIKNNGQNLNNYRKNLEKKKNKNSFLFTFWNLFAMKINFKNLKNSFIINLKLARIIVV